MVSRYDLDTSRSLFWVLGHLLKHSKMSFRSTHYSGGVDLLNRNLHYSNTSSVSELLVRDPKGSVTTTIVKRSYKYSLKPHIKTKILQ